MKKFDINSIKLKIQSPDVKVDDALNEYILEQIEKLGRVFSRIERCEMMLSVSKSSTQKNCEVETKIYVPGNVLFSVNKSDSFRMASKMVFEDLQKQLYKFKDGITDKAGSSNFSD